MEAPRIPSMFGFKSKKANQFYFEPRYYSARKEKMEQRYKRIGKELGVEDSQRMHKEDFKAEMRENWGNSYSRNAAAGQVNKKVLFYVVALVAIAYFLIFY
jgi:hypothetical protein